MRGLWLFSSWPSALQLLSLTVSTWTLAGQELLALGACSLLIYSFISLFCESQMSGFGRAGPGRIHWAGAPLRDAFNSPGALGTVPGPEGTSTGRCTHAYTPTHSNFTWVEIASGDMRTGSGSLINLTEEHLLPPDLSPHLLRCTTCPWFGISTKMTRWAEQEDVLGQRGTASWRASPPISTGSALVR